jgi:hypothetical protein
MIMRSAVSDFNVVRFGTKLGSSEDHNMSNYMGQKKAK